MKDTRKSEWTDDAAIAILQANVGGRKKKSVSPVLMADAAKHLYDSHKSYEKVARLVKVMSGEMVREFYDIATLPEPVRNLIDKGRIKIDVARRISSIRDEKRQIETAEAVADLHAHPARIVIDNIIRNPDRSPEECRESALNTKNFVTKLDTLVFSLQPEEYAVLRQYARKHKTTAGRFAKKIVEDWVKQHAQTKAKGE